MFTTYCAWASRIVLAVAQLLITRLLVSYLGVDEYGFLAIILSFATWLSLTDLGFGSVLQNKYSEMTAKGELLPPLLQTLRFLQRLLVLFWVPFTFVLAIFAEIFISSIQWGGSKSYLLILIFSFAGWALTAIYGINYKILYAMGKGYISNIYPAIASLISICLLMFFLFTKLNADNKFENALISLVLPNLLLAYFSSKAILNDKQPTKPIKFEQIKPLVKPALGFAIFGLLVSCITNLDYIVMAKVLDEKSVAEYNMLSKLFSFAYSFFYSVLLTYWPIFSEKTCVNDFAYVKKIIKNILKKFLICSLGVFGIIYLSKNLLSEILSNGMIELTLGPMLGFTIYYIIRGFCDVYAVTLACTNKTTVFLVYMPIQAVISVLSQFLLSQKYGLIGIPIGLSLSFVATALWINYLSFKNLAKDAT